MKPRFVVQRLSPCLTHTEVSQFTVGFLPRDALVHSPVLRLHVVRPSVRLSVRL